MIRTAYQIECLDCNRRRSFTNTFAREQWKKSHDKRCRFASFGESTLITDYDECEFCGLVGIVLLDSCNPDSPTWCGRCDAALDSYKTEMEAVR